MDDSQVPPVDKPEGHKFEGREVPREPNGRVSRSAIPDLGETVGSAEQITALTVRLAELRAEGKLRGERAVLYKQLNMERARLMRRRARIGRDKAKLRLVRAKAAETVARRTVHEASAAVAGAASVLKRLVDCWTLTSMGPLQESLVKDLASEETQVRQHAQDSIRDMTIAVFDLHKSAQKLTRRDPIEPENIVAEWPTEGGKG